MSINAHELSNRLLNALDNNYNVVDMHTVNEIISILEKFNITKELLETTRLGKHVNELRRKTSDPQLARRAKVLVKRWRDLVIPTVASPGHTALPGSNRSSAERQVRRLGGTPLTSPALSRQVVSPAVPSPRPQSRPAWGGYESDSQDVILVDDDPPLPAPSPLASIHKPLTPPVKRPPSPQPLYDEKKAKRDKKPKRRRGHSRAGSGTEATSPLPNMGGITIPASPPLAPPAAPPAPLAPPPVPSAPWRDRNGTERRRNGKKSKLDPYTAMVNRMPTAGAKKVKTTKELLEEIQSRGSKPPASPGSPDVMLIEDTGPPIKVDSPLRNGGSSPRPPSPPSAEASPPRPPLEEEREYAECTCTEEVADASCGAARAGAVLPLHVRALHHAYLPGVNGTRAPRHPHRYAVRPRDDPARPGLFASVVPLYKYSDYADDHCAKNMARVPLCEHLPWTEFAPPPPEPPPPPSPPPLRPYPIDDVEEPRVPSEENTVDSEATDCSLGEVAASASAPATAADVDIEPEMVGVPELEPSERLKAPILSIDEETQFLEVARPPSAEVEEEFATEHRDHRTVERTKETLTGRQLYEHVRRTIEGIPYDYSQMAPAPVVTLPAAAALEAALQGAYAEAEAEAEAGAETETRAAPGPPTRPDNFAEWHECARLGRLVALPYVVID